MRKFFIMLITLIPLMGINAQNQIITDEKSGKPMAFGECSRTVFADTSFAWWYNSEYNMYTVDSSALQSITSFPKEITAHIVCATWCSDSRREIPRLLKIFDHLQIQDSVFRLTCVDRKKMADGIPLTDLKIELVPTIIFYKDGLEIGRIIETPKQSLEKDIIEILQKKLE